MTEQVRQIFQRARQAFCQWGRRQRVLSIALPALLLAGVVCASLFLEDGAPAPAAPAISPAGADAPEEVKHPSVQLAPEWTLPVMDGESLLAIVDGVAGEYNAVGISAAVVEDGAVTASCGWGMADLGGRAMTADTKVRCASISKVAVAICAMRMIEDGLLTLDGSISPLWGFDVSSRAYPDVPISLELLLTHTSTISELEGLKTLSAAKSQMSGHPFTGAEPGTVWRYSNYGFGILGTTLELACGTNLDAYAQEAFLVPMGMDASFYTANFEPEELASLYRGTVNEWSAAGQANARLPQGIGEAVGFYSGNFTTSAGDYAKLIAMLANDGIYEGVRYLDAASVEEMERPRLTADNGESVFDQCLALRRKEGIYGQDTLYYHTGSAYGVYALMSYNPETKNGVVVISTGADRAVDENGIYGLCAAITQQVYQQIDQAEGDL